MIYVTHDQVEAMTLADRIVVLNAGLVEQVGSPMELYLHPDNLFVARFIGSPAMNTVPCVIESGGATPTVKPQGGTSVKVDIDIPDSAKGATGTFGVRPEDLTLADGPEYIFHGNVQIVEKLGEVTLIYVDCGDAERAGARQARRHRSAQQGRAGEARRADQRPSRLRPERQGLPPARQLGEAAGRRDRRCCGRRNPVPSSLVAPRVSSMPPGRRWPRSGGRHRARSE